MITLNSNTAVLLAGTPVINGINAADFVTQPAVSKPVGRLTITEVQGLIAQAAKSAGQPVDTVSDTNGIGQFGFTPTQLESVGYLKPDTVERFLSDGANLTSVLSSPIVWTGKNGVTTLSVMISDSKVQNSVQYELLQRGLIEIKKYDPIVGNVSLTSINSQELGGIVQATAKFGASEVNQWLRGRASSELVGNIKIIARSGEYAVSIVNNKFPESIKGMDTPTAVSGTVTRTTLDDAVIAINGNDKIPVQSF